MRRQRWAGLIASFTVLIGAGAVLLAGVTASGGVLSTAATPLKVHFTFVSSSDDLGFEFRGAGRLLLPDVPVAKVQTTAPAGTATGSIRIVRGGSSATFHV